MINETGNWTERRETEKRPLRHRARLPQGAIVGNNVGSGSTPAATRQTTCWKCWWAREDSNLQPDFSVETRVFNDFHDRSIVLVAVVSGAKLVR
jgi:hypothetical protein